VEVPVACAAKKGFGVIPLISDKVMTEKAIFEKFITQLTYHKTNESQK
jgi:hypothetical protein